MHRSNAPTPLAGHLERLLSKQARARMQQIRSLQHSLDSLLPPALRPHCQAAGIDGNELVLVVDGGAAATQLRYQQQQIIKQVNADLGLTLRRMRLRIAPPRAPRPRTAPAPRRLSSAAARALNEAARSMPDRALAEILERLARKGAQQQ